MDKRTLVLVVVAASIVVGTRWVAAGEGKERKSRKAQGLHERVATLEQQNEDLLALLTEQGDRIDGLLRRIDASATWLRYVSKEFEVVVPGTSASISAGEPVNGHDFLVEALPGCYVVSGGFHVRVPQGGIGGTPSASGDVPDRTLVSADIVNGTGQAYALRLHNLAPEPRTYAVTLVTVQMEGAGVETDPVILPWGSPR